MKKIELFGDIGRSWFGNGWTLERMREEMREADGTILVEVKSDGGDLLEALAIRDELANSSARVEVNIIGATASAATVIATGGDYIRMTANSRYLIHNAAYDGAALGRLTAEDAEDVAERLKSFDTQVIRLYVKRTGKPRQAIEDLMKQERWLTAEEALRWGFIDEIINPIILNKMDEKDQLIEKLEAEKAALEAKIIELQDKLAAYQEKEIEKKLEEAGIEEAEAKAAMKALGLKDPDMLTKVLNALPKQTLTPPLASVPAQPAAQPPAAPKPSNRREAWELYKAGKITSVQFEEIAKKL
jgi:ATP-dependent protease ClpP protease subunit